MWYVYILKSLRDNKFYYGSTSHLQKRLDEHNRGKVRYTKGHIPWIIHYYEKFETRVEASKRELFFNNTNGYNSLNHSY